MHNEQAAFIIKCKSAHINFYQLLQTEFNRGPKTTVINSKMTEIEMSASKVLIFGKKYEYHNTHKKHKRTIPIDLPKPRTMSAVLSAAYSKLLDRKRRKKHKMTISVDSSKPRTMSALVSAAYSKLYRRKFPESKCPSTSATKLASTSMLDDTTQQTIVIEPGLVLIRNFVSSDECQRLASMATQWGDPNKGEDGFFNSTNETVDGKVRRVSTLNTGEVGRGRIYDAATRFPSKVTDYCDQAVAIAKANDSTMPDMNCTHLLLNMYTTSNGLIWHRDIYENDGKSDHPVVNLCVGASCKFGFKHRDEDPERVLTLRSGDCLLFGGPCRLMKHAVLEVLLDDCPEWMSKESPVRFSFTFRDSPEVLGREEEFKYFKVAEHLVGQKDFKVPSDRTSFKGLPAQTSQRQLMLPNPPKSPAAA